MAGFHFVQFIQKHLLVLSQHWFHTKQPQRQEKLCTSYGTVLEFCMYRFANLEYPQSQYGPYTASTQNGLAPTEGNDCKNIANIMKTLAYRGFIFKQTSKPF
ncbi:hypothetical protein STEG23_006027 [Scotinomys teguina]